MCELRSVNHRFLEAGFRLPDELRAAEGELRARLARQLRRGKVDCTMSYRRPQGAGGALEIDAEALERLLAAVQVVTRALRERQPSMRSTCCAGPGCCARTASAGEQLLAVAYAVFGATLEDLVAARAREGARLRELLEQRCAALEALVARVRARLPEVQARVRARLDERLAELGASVDRERLEQELALLLQRLDVDEELERLAGHIDEVRRVIGAQRAGRPAARLPHAGAQPRSQHAVLQVTGPRDHAHRGGHEGAHRADARAGAERRVVARATKRRSARAVSVA